MQKIMFNDKYGLTQAVLDGRKTMTRRAVPERVLEAYDDYDDYVRAVAPRDIPCTREYEKEFFLSCSPFKVGEVVAVAQRYCDIKEYNPEDYEDVMLSDGAICEASHPYAHLMREPGWTNKMFVRAELMPYRIRITSVHIERLQDISDEDCIREGINVSNAFEIGYGIPFVYDFKGCKMAYETPREAFAALIDKVSGKGTWDSNPWVYVNEFEKVK